ncbi:hypothetical protein [Variovorax sp. KK3]|nr:hypothetical protein [Variovorax sp. KK3]
MNEAWLHALCALAAFLVPLCFAWLMVSRVVRRQTRRRRRGDGSMR